MAISKNARQQVYAKFDGHCAYCGRRIELEEMQIDHIHPKYLGGNNEMDNLNPACRMCNFRKGTLTLKKFRKAIQNQADAACSTFQARMSIAYGLIRRIDKPVEFYFEKINKNNYGNNIQFSDLGTDQ